MPYYHVLTFWRKKMHRKLTLGIISVFIIAAWLISPVAVLAQDITPTDTPTEIPVEITTEAPTETVVTGPDITEIATGPTDGPTLSLSDITDALVEAATAVGSGDPSGTLSDAAVDFYKTTKLINMPYGTPFNYIKPGGSPGYGTCDYGTTRAGTFTCYWEFPLQQAINDAASDSEVLVESTIAPYLENVIFNASTPSLRVTGTGSSTPIIEGSILFDTTNNIRFSNLTINGWIHINDSTNIVIDNVEINQSAMNDALYIEHSSDIEILDSTINQSGGGNGITATDVSILNIYGTLDDGPTIINMTGDGLYGIYAQDTTDGLAIGGDGWDMGGFDPGDGVVVNMTDTPDGSTAISVNTHTGGVMIGDGVQVNINFSDMSGDFPNEATGIAINNVTGAVLVGMNTEVNITGGNGTGILINGVYQQDLEPELLVTDGDEEDILNGLVAVGENLDVNLNKATKEGWGEFGGNGTGISVNDIEGLTMLGSLQDFLTSTDIGDSSYLAGDHRTTIRLDGQGIGLLGTNLLDIFASGITTYVPGGRGAVFGEEPATGFVRGVAVGMPGENTGTLYIANSTFSGNGYGGLTVRNQNGDLILDHVTANDNGESGASLEIIGCNVMVSNSIFNGNLGYGLDITTPDGVLIDNVEAAYNDYDGINLVAGSDVTILNSFMHHNDGAGVGIWSSIPTMTRLMLVPEISLPAVDAYVYNSVITDNARDGESAGINYQGLGTLTVCGSTVSGNGVDFYLADPGVLNYSPFYPCGGEKTASPKQEGTGPLVIPVDFTTDFSQAVPSGKAKVPNAQGLVFKLIETKDDSSKIIWVQASIPAGAAPTGADAGFVQVPESGLPTPLPEGSTFVGAAFSLQLTDLGGSAISNLSGEMEVKFRLPDGFSVPSGQELVIFLYDASGTWVKLPATISGGYAYVYTNALGTFVLGLSPLP
jgi:hypothetical protein